MSSFTLDKDIFRPSLYKQVQNVWFEGHELGAKELDMKILKRWFMASPEEKVIFDGVCRESFAHALEAIGPERMPNPSAEPFLREIQNATQGDSTSNNAEGAWMALSLVLLLDQISRNIFRTNEGLVKVYNHYDAIAYSLVQSMLSPHSPVGRPDLHPQWRTSVVHRMWFYMPLMHSEEIKAHELFDELTAGLEDELAEKEGNEAMRHVLQQNIKAEKEHRAILDKFGRYPHRNGALGRRTTVEERKFMDEGGATFGIAQDESKA
jgi:uncharacterized protein (DUF924 family)